MQVLKQLKDDFYEALAEEPTKEKLRDFLRDFPGEGTHCDCKRGHLNKVHLSKEILALANSGGGLIIFGVDELEEGSINPIGLNQLLDAAELHNQVSKFVPDRLNFEILNVEYETSEYEKLKGKKFQLLIVSCSDEHLPYMCNASSDGKEGRIEKDTIYIRRSSKCEKINATELEEIINKRVESKYSSAGILDLEKHLEQLQILYSSINKEIKRSIFDPAVETITNTLGRAFGTIKEKNPYYPEESYDAFIAKIIEKKKVRIGQVLDLT